MVRRRQGQPSSASLQIHEKPMKSRILNVGVEKHGEHLGMLRVLAREHGHIVAQVDSDVLQCAHGVRQCKQFVSRDKTLRVQKVTWRVAQCLGFGRKSAKATK